MPAPERSITVAQVRLEQEHAEALVRAQSALIGERAVALVRLGVLGLIGISTGVLDKVSGDHDLVLVDCPPSLGGLTRIGLAAADRAIIVTEPGVFAIAAADRALRAVHDVRTQLNPRLQPLGIVINRVRPNIGEHRYRVEELTSLFGPLVLTQQIPERTAVQRAQGAYVPIHALRNPGAREVAALFDGILAHALRAARRQRP